MTTLSPLVSAIIPTRNRPDLVLRAIRSALDQTYRDIEVVVVVDGPDPDTLSELAKIRDNRLIVVANAESVGGAEARNVGARAARGEWIALLDDDDEWLPGKIEKQLAKAQAAGGEAIIVTSQFFARTEGSSDVIRPRRLPAAGERICEYMFDFLCYFQTSTIFCRRSLFLAVPFQKGLRAFHDIDWFLRVNARPEVQLLVVPEPLTIYYAPSERASITSSLGWESRLAWGQANRGLMTRLAYSRFIAGSVSGRAAMEKGGLKALSRLLRESVVRGSGSLSQILIILGTFMVSPATRRRLRDLLFLSTHRVDDTKGLSQAL